MEKLTKKTTILLQPELHECLIRLAEQRGTSLGDLIRTACETQYGLAGSEERIRAVRALVELPVGTSEKLKRQSVPERSVILP